MAAVLRIGTRGSPLALAQTREAVARLGLAFPELSSVGAIAIEIIRTTGDRMVSGPLAEIGGKGLFTKEIEEALADGRIDLAVHSMKDMPTALPPGLEIAAVLPREDPRDALVAPAARSLGDLAPGALVGTASIRRRAILLNRRPDLVIVPMRGNVDTRLKKLAAGEVGATVLAIAGLKRLGRTAEAAAILSPEEMLPAVCQGAIGIECRSSDTRMREFLTALDDSASAITTRAERALLAALDGSCRTPIAGLAELAGDRVSLRALIVRPDGGHILETRREGPASSARALGEDAGRELRGRAGPEFFVA